MDERARVHNTTTTPIKNLSFALVGNENSIVLRVPLANLTLKLFAHFAFNISQSTWMDQKYLTE